MNSPMRFHYEIGELKTLDRPNGGEEATHTLKEQMSVENAVLEAFRLFEERASLNPIAPSLRRRAHGEYLKKSLRYLPANYDCLDASRPWMCFWILNSLQLLEDMPDRKTLSDVVGFLAKCQHPDGGYGGGPGQHAHLAPTYAAVNALCIIGTEEAHRSVDRDSLRRFLLSVRSEDGAFAMHRGGEVDIRGAYCALNVARLTNVFADDLFDGTAEWIVGCQTYEGGFGGSQGMEAHGGYAFCAIAGLSMLGRPLLCDADALLRWCANRQMRLEGGFQGRTNKLVDGCYSFWQGAIFPILHAVLFQKGLDVLDNLLFDRGALQEYVLVCCENPSGGFIDKPGKRRDLYHTNYVLSGLSIAQHGLALDKVVIGDEDNELNTLHPVHCISPDSVFKAAQYFNKLPIPNTQKH